MRSVRWCPEHSVELEDRWDGCSCSAGHRFYTSKGHPKGVYWIVDLDRKPDDPKFHMGTVVDGHAEYEPWFDCPDEPTETEHIHLDRPQHWAKPHRLSGRSFTFMERVLRGRFDR